MGGKAKRVQGKMIGGKMIIQKGHTEFMAPSLIISCSFPNLRNLRNLRIILSSADSFLLDLLSADDFCNSSPFFGEGRSVEVKPTALRAGKAHTIFYT